MKKHLLSLVVAFAGVGVAFSQNVELASDSTPTVGIAETGTDGVMEGTLYSNGPYYNVEGSPNISLLQDTSLGMDTFGFGASDGAGQRIADDWIVTENVTVDSFQFYAYQTGSTSTSTISYMTVQIWDGAPDNPSSTVIWGDEFDDVLSETEFSGAYRQLESSPGDTSRPIMVQTVNTPGLTLTPGTYWIDYNFGGTLGSGPWAPPVTITGEVETGNGMQFTTTGWASVVDSGPATPQGFPFEVNGTADGMGVNDLTTTSFSIYPNPTSKFLNVNAKNTIDGISVYNLAGQEVMKVSPKSINAALDVSSLPKGTYVVKTSILGKVKTQKFVKK
ncbi:MAG: T9SS type A sorting domain-containing protein [Weeksellaceae bacterium]